MPGSECSVQQAPNASSESLGVVITGGSKGLGFALAKAFLAEGDRVLIAARDTARLERAADALRASSSGARGRVHTLAVDVGRPDDVEALACSAQRELGKVDVWLNNAGRASGARRPLWELDAADVLETATVNCAGALLGSRAAMRLFVQQAEARRTAGIAGARRYALYNFGYSQSGASLSSSTVPHKSSKRGVAELSYFLAKEVAKAGLDDQIGVYECSPGLVLTDLLLTPDTPPGLRRFFNTIAEEPDVVAEWMVPRIRELDAPTGEVRFLTLFDAASRLLSRLPQVIQGGRHFDENGERVGNPDDFSDTGVRKPY